MSIDIEIRVPKNLWISENGAHGDWRVVARKARSLKYMGFLNARHYVVTHHAHFERCHVTAEILYPPHAHRADPTNANRVTKHLIDGFTQAGLWPDDDSEHVIGPDHRRSVRKAQTGWHVVVFHIEEV